MDIVVIMLFCIPKDTQLGVPSQCSWPVSHSCVEHFDEPEIAYAQL